MVSQEPTARVRARRGGSPPADPRHWTGSLSSARRRPRRQASGLFLGIWFLFQLVEGNFGLFSASANGGGTAFFAHVGGFLFGVLVARLLAGASLRAMPDAA
jgi:membrane associated rhomboid family serine protease